MTDPLLLLALLTLLGWSLAVAVAARGTRRIASLVARPPLAPESCPSLTVVVAARDEERDLDEALRSLIAQDYPNLEIVAIDDRSSDGTAGILDGLAAEHAALEVLHVRELPGGWLGKCHALHRGAAAARGEWLLFTDADVVFEPTALRRAMGYAAEQRLDHLAVMPDIDMPGPVLGTFAGTFAIAFSTFARPWRARDPRSKAHIGIGAFNLVRAAAYHERGGHTSIAMRPDDDLRLGRLMKSGGGRQDCVFGKGVVAVRWYRGLGEILRGLEKNAFAAVDYHLSLVVVAVAGEVGLVVWPFVAPFVTDGVVRVLNAAIVALLLSLFAATARGISVRRWYGVFLPFGVLFLAFAQCRATLLTLMRGGIVWRGTFYSLRDLRDPPPVTHGSEA